MNATDLDPRIARYVEFWNTEPADAQARLGAEVFAPGIEYRSVPGLLTGTQALVDFRSQFVEHVGSATYRPRGAVDQHHDRVRLPWEIVLADGTSFAAGTDVIALGLDRIESVTSFLDRAPSGLAADAHHEPR